jgi:hypothetical protein
VLVAAVAIAGGYFVGFAATRPAGADPSPTPTPVETPDPSPTPTPSPSPTPTPTPIPTATPTPTPSPSPQPTRTRPPAPSRTPAPSPNLARPAGIVVIQFLKVRLDDEGSAAHEARRFTFTTDRAGELTASLFGTTGGKVELCMIPAAPDNTPAPDLGSDSFCDELTQGVKRSRTPARRQDWTVELRAAESGQRPTTDLLLRFPAATGGVSVSGFPFQGTELDDANGFTARLVTNDSGTLRVLASWTDADSDSTHDYGLSVFDVTDGARAVYRTAGTASSLDARVTLRSDRRFDVTIENRDVMASARVSLKATLTWP